MGNLTRASERPSRRRFIRAAIGRNQVVTLSCAQLYIRYVDALGIGRPEMFAEYVRREVCSGAEVVLTDREWLDREDFAAAIAAILDRS